MILIIIIIIIIITLLLLLLLLLFLLRGEGVNLSARPGSVEPRHFSLGQTAWESFLASRDGWPVLDHFHPSVELLISSTPTSKTTSPFILYTSSSQDPRERSKIFFFPFLSCTTRNPSSPFYFHLQPPATRNRTPQTHLLPVSLTPASLLLLYL